MSWRLASFAAAAVLAGACAGRGSSTPGTGGEASAGGARTGTGGKPGGTGAGGTTGTTGGAGGDAGGGDASDAGDAGDGAAFDCAVLGVPGVCMDTTTCSAMTDYTPTAGECPGAADVQCCTPYGIALCNPDAMPRPQPNAGNTTEAPGVGGCPAGMLEVTTFCVDAYEATLVRVDDGSPWCPFDNPGTTAVRAISVAGAVPQGYISGVQAGQACMNAGKRLCADDEWLRACQGPDGYTYPYGDTDELGVCNDHRSEHPAVEYYDTTASWIYDDLDNSCLDQLPETVDPTGSRKGCITVEGAHDMMGNLHEWTSNATGAFRGGYFMDTVENGPGCLYVTTAHDTSYWDYSTGFRCCAD